MNKPSKIYPQPEQDPFLCATHLLQAAVRTSAPCSKGPSTRAGLPTIFAVELWACRFNSNVTTHMVSTQVSGCVPGCSTAQARADFPPRQQLPGCHPPATHAYLKMHLCSQQLLVELRVLQDMVSMANALSLQEINCLENVRKPHTA